MKRMELYQWICVVGIPSIISGIFMLIVNRGMIKRDKKQDEIRQQNETLEKQSKAIMAGVQAMLRDRLLTGYKHYQEKGWADYDDRSNMENIWKQYHALGANGVMDDMRAAFRKLPMRQGGEPTAFNEDERNEREEEG